ncbi:diaminopimelate epimerase [Thalassospira sp.]|uniref:diaminopimelate epimerase n=1 Tax=Thalassospira sp. TaxID=1912094 RepID=UPI0027362D86|nr:diaminopimelate epimerase [Thalassospira sp.]MDP2699570.1 diaminopimelate epimerase [Thalassospira sp.]
MALDAVCFGHYKQGMNNIPFVKMHGLGNDFVVFDGRRDPAMLDLDNASAARIADRKTGVGCDQLIVIEPPRDRDADAFMRIRNNDGGEVGACGNAARCIADILMTELQRRDVTIQTVAGLLEANGLEDGRVTVDMGIARLDWRDIPLAEAADTNHIPVALGDLRDPVGVNVGNPHAVFFVENAERIDIEKLGPVLEHHAMFPERANIEVCHIISPDRIRMRVWERGVGVTRACGTGACAVGVAAARRGLTGRKVDIVLDGGELTIEWLPDEHVLMTGPVSTSFSGFLHPSLLGLH